MAKSKYWCNWRNTGSTARTIDQQLVANSWLFSSHHTWWGLICWVITAKEVRLRVFVVLCHTCRLITGHGRILSGGVQREVLLLCDASVSGTSHDCGTQAEVEGPSAGVWQNPHEPQGLTGSVSWTVLLCYSSSRGHLWQRWKNLHRNWLVTVTVSGAGPPDGSAMNVVNHSLIDAWLLPQLILVHCSTCTAFLLAAAWCVHERRLIAD